MWISKVNVSKQLFLTWKCYLQDSEKVVKSVVETNQTEISINVTVTKGEVSIKATDSKGKNESSR